MTISQLGLIPVYAPELVINVASAKLTIKVVPEGDNIEVLTNDANAFSITGGTIEQKCEEGEDANDLNLGDVVGEVINFGNGNKFGSINIGGVVRGSVINAGRISGSINIGGNVVGSAIGNGAKVNTRNVVSAGRGGISIGGDCVGNVIVTGDGNQVFVNGRVVSGDQDQADQPKASATTPVELEVRIPKNFEGMLECKVDGDSTLHAGCDLAFGDSSIKFKGSSRGTINSVGNGPYNFRIRAEGDAQVVVNAARSRGQLELEGRGSGQVHVMEVDVEVLHAYAKGASRVVVNSGRADTGRADARDAATVTLRGGRFNNLKVKEHGVAATVERS